MPNDTAAPAATPKLEAASAPLESAVAPSAPAPATPIAAPAKGGPATAAAVKTVKLTTVLAAMDRAFEVAVPGSEIASPPGNYNILLRMHEEMRSQIITAASHES